MSTPTEEVTLDIDALDAEVAKGRTNGAATEPIEVETAADAKQPEKTVITPEQGIEKLQKQLDAERANTAAERTARLAAENRANDAAHGEAAARTDVQKTQLDLVTSAIERVIAANDTLESQYADAMGAQDFKAAAKVQRQMSDNSAKLAQLEAGKAAMEKAPKPVPRAIPDPVEQWATNIGPQFPRSQAWVRAHPEFARDEKGQQQMVAAHQIALARGHTADSDGYFASIEKTLDITPAVTRTETPDPADDPMSGAASTPVNGGRQAAPAAPVSRSGNGTGGSRPTRMTLSANEVEAAHASFPDMDPKKAEQTYALNKLALQKEGKLQ